MLTSLFGDLRATRDAKAKDSEFADTQVGSGGQDFAATAIMESIATEVNERGQIIDRHVSDLVVTGSPAQAIREPVRGLGQTLSARRRRSRHRGP